MPGLQKRLGSESPHSGDSEGTAELHVCSLPPGHLARDVKPPCSRYVPIVYDLSLPAIHGRKMFLGWFPGPQMDRIEALSPGDYPLFLYSPSSSNGVLLSLRFFFLE